MALGKGRAFGLFTVFTALFIASVIISFALGHYDMTPLDVLKVASNQLLGTTYDVPAPIVTIVTQIRFPRIVAAVIIGAALTGAGASYQGLFKNPMVSPDLLGASAGAGAGACLALLLGAGMFAVQCSAFVCGIVAVLLTYSVAKIVSKGDNMTLSLVLTGMVVSSLFQALISISKYMADPNDRLPSITYWLMGGLSGTQPVDLPMLIVPVLAGSIPMILFRYQLNALSFGDEEARSLGVNVTMVRWLYIICATLVTAGSVAAAGMIGWVGLVIPHLTRMIVGPNYKALLPASLLIGATFMVLIDDICRCAFTLEVPLSVATSIVGAPFFIYLLVKGKKTWV